MKKRDIGILLGGTVTGMSLALSGSAMFILKEKFTRQAPHAAKPGQIESIDEMHTDYLRRKGLGIIKEQNVEDLQIISRDGLTLRAHYVHNTTVKRKAGEPVKLVLLSHGYGGSGYKDMSIFAEFYIKEGFDLLIIDQRTHGASEGTTITFGAKEHDDISDWVDKAIEIAGSDCKILLHGWSMGAASIYLACAHSIAPQVLGLVYDCGFAMAEAQMMFAANSFAKLPLSLLWYMLQFLKPLCRLFYGFNLSDASPVSVSKNMTLPIFFVHGSRDSLVPCRMGRRLFKATTSSPYRKMLIVPEVDHTYSYVRDKAGYEAGVRELMRYCGF